ncbi:MAG: LamG domain-containing protein [Cyanobium sp. LacPavin_0920_WC12_MAG_62_9]|nr:LamG domain-containing protein [Cyanobium sp. LacPavin_0920_WC12_MAG_62_9]
MLLIWCKIGGYAPISEMSSTASKLGLVLTDTGASGSDRRTSNGDLDILGLLIGNTSLDVSKLNSTNTSIDTKELVGEGGTYTGVPGTLIAYGKTGNNSWSYRLVPASGQLAINNGVFGDPLYSVYKYAYIATSSLAPGGATQAFWQFSTNGGASWSASQTVGVKNTIKLNEGDYKDGQVQIRQVDATGKVLNTLSDFGAFTVDKTAPTPSIIDLGGADKTFSTQVGDNVIKGRAEAGLKVNIFAKESKFEDFSSGQLPSWIKFDIPNPSIANINFDAKNGELDFDAKGGRTNLWTSRDNSPFAYVSRPTVALGETWFIETTVRLDARNQGGSLAGITFYDDKNGSFQYGAPQFALDGWNTKGGTNVSLQTLGNGSFFNTTSGTNSGPSSAALDFDGRDDFISVPTTSPLPGGNSTYTLEAWIKPDVHATNGIVGWGPWGSGNSVNALRLGTGGTIHNYWWGNDLIVQSGISLTDGKWHHVAATFDGTTRSIYVDGVLKGSDKPKGHNASTTTNNLRIGSTNNGEYFDGSIDDVAIWNKALSQQEITARQTTPPIGSESGLVAFYGLNETTGNSVSSQGSAATLLTGTLTNGPIRTTRSNASSTGATSISGETAQVNLRVEVTENGKADLYTFYYRAKDTDGWSQLGTSTSFEIDNARAALFYKTDGAKAGLASFDNVKVGKLTDVLLGQADVTADGKFEYTLSEKDIQTLGEGLQKEIYASQTDLAGNTGRSASLMAAVDTVATPVVITSIGTKDNVVSMLKEEQGKGAVKYKLDQYTGFQSNNLATLRDYVAKFNPNADPNKKLATVYTDTIDFTDDQGGFAGDLPFDRRWPAAELANAWGTGGINNTFFARITTDFYIEDAQKYRFRTYNDDGVFLLVDDKLIISDTGYHPEARFYGDIDLGKGNHTLELFFFEAG